MFMQDPTERIVHGVRIAMIRVARGLNRVSRGHIRPSHITLLSLLGHIPAVWALWTVRPYLASLLIAVFGLMDALDGALAREQGSASKLGMFFDAVTDRLKEIMVYAGLGVFVYHHPAYFDKVGLWAIPALAGTSILVSFVKAKGEMAIAETTKDRQALNRQFSQGIARYEIRMSLLILGLLSGYLAPILNLLIALNLLTAAERFIEVAQRLSTEDKKQATPKITHKKTS